MSFNFDENVKDLVDNLNEMDQQTNDIFDESLLKKHKKVYENSFKNNVNTNNLDYNPFEDYKEFN